MEKERISQSNLDFYPCISIPPTYPLTPHRTVAPQPSRQDDRQPPAEDNQKPQLPLPQVSCLPQYRLGDAWQGINKARSFHHDTRGRVQSTKTLGELSPCLAFSQSWCQWTNDNFTVKPRSNFPIHCSFLEEKPSASNSTFIPSQPCVELSRLWLGMCPSTYFSYLPEDLLLASSMSNSNGCHHCEAPWISLMVP